MVVLIPATSNLTSNEWECVSAKFLQLSQILQNPGTVAQPGSSGHEILKASMLEWVAMPSSKRSSQPRDWIQVSHISGRFFTIWAIKEDQERAWAWSFIKFPDFKMWAKEIMPAVCMEQTLT